MKSRPAFHRLAILVATLLITATLSQLRADTHVWSGAVNGYWNVAGNWSSGGVPVVGETNLRLTFPSGAARTLTTNNIGALTVTTINLSGNGYIVRGSGTLTLPGLGLTMNIISSGSNTVESPLQLTSLNSVSTGPDGTLVLAGSISGTGSLYKYGYGTLVLAGWASNPFSGGLKVIHGDVSLNKTGGALALVGPISIGTTNGTDITSLHIDANDQISDGADITIQPSGVLVLGNPNLAPVTDVVGSLSMVSGYVHTWNGRLGVAGDWGMDSVPAPFPQPDYAPIVSGNISFHGPACTVTVTNGYAEFDVNILNGGSPTVINKAGVGTLHLKGTGNFNGPLNVKEGKVIAETSTSLGTTAGSTTVSAGASLQWRGGVMTSESLSLAGVGVGGVGALQLGGGAAYCYGNISLNGECSINVLGTNDLMLLGGVISGTGALRKIGPGELMLSGASANTFTGGTLVSTGRLSLNKTAGVRAVGVLTSTNQAQVVFKNSNQIENAVPVSVLGRSTLNLAGFNQSIGELVMGSGAVVDSGTGTLTLLGNLTARYANDYAGPSTVRGRLSLGGALRTFSFHGPNLVLDCEISDGAGVGGIHFKGMFLQLQKASTFSGPAILDGCAALVTHGGAFGQAGGGVALTNNATINLRSNVTVTAETLILAGGDGYLGGQGTNGWNGLIQLVNSNSVLNVNGSPSAVMSLGGAISGHGGLLLYGGTIRMIGTNANTYKGLTDMSWGDIKLELNKTNAQALPGEAWLGTEPSSPAHLIVRRTNQIADTARLRFMAGDPGLVLPYLELQADETIGTLEGEGSIGFYTNKLTVGIGNTPSSFGGYASYSLHSEIKKVGAGDFEVTHGMSDAAISIFGGSVRFNGGDPNPLVSWLTDSRVTVHPGGKLAGVGGPFLIDGRGGRVEPGRELGDGNYGVLRAGILMLNTNTIYRCELGGTNAGVNQDRLSAQRVAITNAVLELSVTTDLGTNQVCIIENQAGNPVYGTFAGLPEGVTFTSGGGRRFQITYQGGDGNDVVLTPAAPVQPGHLGGIQMQGDGTIQLVGAGAPGVEYFVQANANLNTTNWVNLGSVIADGNGGIDFIDYDASNFPMRFYRFVIP